MQLGVAVVLLSLTVLGIVLPSETVTEQVVRIPNTELMDTREGVTTTVSVHQVPVNNASIKLLASSGLVVAGNDEDIRSGQQTLGHLGTFLNKNSREVLTVGFGSGETSACLSTHDLERLDCVEISPELVELALRHFGDINLGDDLNREVNMLYMDGKNYLHLTDRHYDLIMNGANVPSQTGSAPVFAREQWTARHKIMYEASTHIIEAQQRQDTVTPLRHIAAGLQLMPDHPALLDQKNRVLARVQGDLHRGQNDRFFTDKIIEDMNAVLATAPDFSSAWLISSQALQFRQDWPNAVAAAGKAVETDPENAFTRLNLGMLLQRTGNTEEAMVHLLEAVRLQPDNAGRRRALGSVYNMTGQRDKAIGEFREAIRLAPDDRVSKAALQKLLGESR